MVATVPATAKVGDVVSMRVPKVNDSTCQLFTPIAAPALLTPRPQSFGTFSDEVAVRGGSTAYFTVFGYSRPEISIRARDLSDHPLPSGMRMWVVRLQ